MMERVSMYHLADVSVNTALCDRVLNMQWKSTLKYFSVLGSVERHHLLLRQFDTHNHNYRGLFLDGINYRSMECIFESKIVVIQNPQVVDNPTPICQSLDLYHNFD